MMAHSFTGRCALSIKRLALVALVSTCPQVLAASAEDFDVDVRDALVSADAAWTLSLLLPEPENTAYDEQIFIELSPILDSPQGVRLPEDQQMPE